MEENKLTLTKRSGASFAINNNKLILKSDELNFEIDLELLKKFFKNFSNLAEEIGSVVLRTKPQTMQDADSILLKFEQKMKASK